MSPLNLMGEIRRALRERGIDPKTRIEPAVVLRRRLAVEMAKAVPYDVRTVDRVLELAAEADLKDPETFLGRCSTLGLDPIAVLNAARLGIPLEQRFRDRPPVVWTFRLPRSRAWLAGGWVILTASLGGLVGAIRFGEIPDVGLSIVLIAGAILIILVESRRLP